MSMRELIEKVDGSVDRGDLVAAIESLGGAMPGLPHVATLRKAIASLAKLVAKMPEQPQDARIAKARVEDLLTDAKAAADMIEAATGRIATAKAAASK